MKRVGLLIIIVILFFPAVVNVFNSSSTEGNQNTKSSEHSQLENIEDTEEEQNNLSPSKAREDTQLTHDELLGISKKDPNSLIGKEYEMTLYLEQPPTTTQAEFITILEDTWDTILLTCNLSLQDISSLREEDILIFQYPTFPEHRLRVKFLKHDTIEFQGNIGHYYKADCSLIN